MLPKRNRLDTKTVEKVFKMGNFINSSNFSLKFIKNTGVNIPRISFVVPKTLSKSAVIRNSLRRLGYNAVGIHIDALPEGFAGVFVFKNKKVTLDGIKQDLSSILKKI